MQCGNTSRILSGLVCALLAFLIDQLSKFAVAEIIMQPRREIYITEFLNIVLSYNKGISFGIMSDYFGSSPIVLSILTSMVVVGLSVWMLFSKTVMQAIALGLTIGGASGNVYDRIHQGAVTDFIDLHLGTWHWPTFNTADIAIVIGAAFLVASTLSDRQTPDK